MMPVTGAGETIIVRVDSARRRATKTLLLMVEISALFGLLAVASQLWQLRQALQQDLLIAQPEQAVMQSGAIAGGWRLLILALGIAFALVLVHLIKPVRWPAGEKVLLTLEVTAVFLLLAAVTTLGETRRDLNDAFRMLQQAEAHRMPAMMAAAPQKRVPQRDQAGRIQIPAIDVNSLIYQHDREDGFKLGVVQIGQTVSPGHPGNLVLAAHNNVYGEIFRDLDQLKAGQEIMLHDDSGSYTYLVRETLLVEPTDVWVTLPTSAPTLTLVSCYPYLLGEQRIVVFADLVE